MEKRCTPDEEEEEPEAFSKDLCDTEFKLKIMINMLNGIEWDRTITGSY